MCSSDLNKKTLFQAASISKIVTSLVILKLVELGKLKLNDDANKYLQDFEIRDKTGLMKKITIKQLLSHAGEVSCSGFRGYSNKEKIPGIEQILKSKPLSNSEKIFVKYGQDEYHYSGGGYIILQKIIENITKEKFENTTRKFIFEPLKMGESFFEKLDKKKISNFALGYEGKKKVKGDFFFYPEKAAAGLWTTAEDLSKLLIEIQISCKEKLKKVLSQKSIKKILTPVIKVEENFMGLGVFISKNRKFFFHAGSNMGYKSKFIMDLNGNGIVVLTNSSKGYEFINELVS